MIWKILGLFVNTLTTYGKYSLLNRDNLSEPIQMQLSKKLSALLECRSKFEHFEQKDDPHSLSISENTDCERRG